MSIFSLDWRRRKQIFYIGILSIIALAVVGYFVFRVIPETTCFDNIQNQGEEGTDCGGPCQPCLKDLSEPVVLWTRLLRLSDGLYEVVALVENSHNFAASDRFFYRVKIYDQDNIVVGLSEGETFINPNEKFLILEANLVSGERLPVRALIEFEPVLWRYSEYSPPNITVTSREFSLLPLQPTLSAVIKNNDIFSIDDIQVAAILSDETGTVIGASFTNVDSIGGRAEKTVSFSWPDGALDEEPKFIEFLIRRFTPAVR